MRRNVTLINVIPETESHKRDKSSLSRDKLHDINGGDCDTITLFFIRRSMYFAFFGKLDRVEYRTQEDLLGSRKRSNERGLQNMNRRGA